jgi:hypothetical protein
VELASGRAFGHKVIPNNSENCPMMIMSDDGTDCSHAHMRLCCSDTLASCGLLRIILRCLFWSSVSITTSVKLFLFGFFIFFSSNVIRFCLYFQCGTSRFLRPKWYISYSLIFLLQMYMSEPCLFFLKALTTNSNHFNPQLIVRLAVPHRHDIHLIILVSFSFSLFASVCFYLLSHFYIIQQLCALLFIATDTTVV